jgi:pimeloyl-ACP methyl ester carboxylesterase
MSERDPILLLHGQPGGAHDWDLVVEQLPPGARALAIDRPGWNGFGSAGDLHANALAALAALDAAGARRGTVVGHSFGGAVAAWLAAHYPDRVGALVLAAPAANAASLGAVDRWLAAPFAGYLASVAMMVGAGMTLSAPPARRLIGARLHIDQSFLRDASHTLRRPASWSAFAVEQRALIRQLPDLEAALGMISAPTTIVIGTHDRVVPPSSARRLAEQIPGAELVEIPGASHLLAHEQAERLAAVIVDSGRLRN